MPMRSPRRTFASPMVVVLGAAAATTAAAAAGCSGRTLVNPPPTDLHHPATDAAPAPAPADAAPDEPVGPGGGYTVAPPAKQPGEQRWHVTRAHGKAGSIAMLEIECPKPATPGGPVATCNPPPPVDYACPDDVTLDHPLTIRKLDGATECFVLPAGYTCPAGAICNPPPPRKLACPTP